MKMKWMMLGIVAMAATAGCAYAEESTITQPPTITKAELPKLEAECKKLSEATGKPHQLVTGTIVYIRRSKAAPCDCFNLPLDKCGCDEEAKFSNFLVHMTHSNIHEDETIYFYTKREPVEQLKTKTYFEKDKDHAMCTLTERKPDVPGLDRKIYIIDFPETIRWLK